MATETLRPDADGDTLQWTPTGGTTHWTEVDEVTSDGDTTRLSQGTPVVDQDDLVNLAASAISASAIIDSVQLNLQARYSGDPPVTFKFLWKENGTTTPGGTLAVTTSYATYSESRSVRPSDGAAWTLTDLNALQVGVRGQPAAVGACRVTQVWIVVTYHSQAARLSLLGVGK